MRWGMVAALVAVYLAIAALYAVYTPPWQVPDEPAHYNYVAQVVGEGCCPVIAPGDYDQSYLNELTSTGFPEDANLAPIEYEDHQPPLYYLLAAPIFALSKGSLLALRLFSVLLGAGVVVLTTLVVARLLPTRPEVALASAAFVAFVPQHVAMMAGVNNDSLAEVVLGLNLLALVAYLGNPPPGREKANRDVHPTLLGVLVGLAFLSKATVTLVAPPLVALAIFLRRGREGRSWGWLVRQAAWAGGVALAIGALWWGRDVAVYGWPDLFGLAAHKDVASAGGQLRTADLIADIGRGPYVGLFLTTTFHSFWGQFGWMGVPMPPRTYLLIGLLVVWDIVGFCGLMLVFQKRLNLVWAQRAGLWLLGGLIALTGVGYLVYNLTFVQFQGRYLFPALPALGLLASLGALGWSLPLRERWPALRWLPVAAMGLLALLDVWALFRFVVPNLA